MIGLAEGRPEWVVGFLDETWFSRLARPALHSWSEAGEPLRLIEQSVAKDDPDPKAISCYGLYVPGLEKVWVRFVDGRPVSSITTRFLSWCCQKLQAVGKRVLTEISFILAAIFWGTNYATGQEAAIRQARGLSAGRMAALRRLYSSPVLPDGDRGRAVFGCPQEEHTEKSWLSVEHRQGVA